MLCNLPNSSLVKKTPLSCVTLDKSLKFFVLRFLHRKMRLITVHMDMLVDMNLSKLWEIVKNREAWRPAVHGVTKSWTRLSD